MKKIIVLLTLCGLATVLWGGYLAPPASAILGDVNASGTVEVGDVVYLINYLFKSGPPPPNPIDADVDGSPGIDLADVLQLTDYCIYHNCSLLPYTGASLRGSSQIRFSSDLIFPMSSGTQDTTCIRIIANSGPDLMGMVIPLSYANQPNQVEVTLDDISFVGSIIPPGWNVTSLAPKTSPWSMPLSSGKFPSSLVPTATIDNKSKTVLLTIFADNPTDPSLVSGTVGIVVTLYFTKVTDGDPLALSVTEVPPSHSFMLMSSYCADGVPPSERILTPMISLALNGDVNCDGIVDVGDVVYTINYLFKHGPSPCGM